MRPKETKRPELETRDWGPFGPDFRSDEGFAPIADPVPAHPAFGTTEESKNPPSRLRGRVLCLSAELLDHSTAGVGVSTLASSFTASVGEDEIGWINHSVNPTPSSARMPSVEAMSTS